MEALGAEGCDAISISKYRLGIGMLLADDPEGARLDPLRRCFVWVVRVAARYPGNEREHG